MEKWAKLLYNIMVYAVKNYVKLWNLNRDLWKTSVMARLKTLEVYLSDICDRNT